MTPERQTERELQARRLRILWALLGASSVALVLVTGILAEAISTNAERVARQLEINRRLPELNDTYLALTQAETGQRGYLLTGRQRYLAAYEDAVARLPPLLARIEALGATEPSLRSRGSRIHQLAQAKLVELAKTIALQDNGQREAALALVQTDDGQRLMEQLRAELEAAVVQLRSERSGLAESLVAEGQGTRILATGAIVALAASALLAAMQLRQLSRSRSRYERELLESQRFLRRVADAIPVRLAYFDREQRIVFANEAASQRYRRPLADVIGRLRSELMADTDDPGERHFAAALRGEHRRYEVMEGHGDAARCFEIDILPDVGEAGEVRGLYATGVDVTQRKADQRAMGEARRQIGIQAAALESVLEAIPAMVAVYDRQCRYRLVNRAFESFTGVSRQRCIGHGVDEVFGADELAQSRPWMERALSGETVSYEKISPSLPGRHVSVSYVPLRLPGGEVDGFVGVGQDVTQHREETRRLVNLSERDPLTGLLNRVGLSEAMKRCQADGRCERVAVLYVDLDDFKSVNDRHGHAAGDEVLRQFAARLRESLRPSDFIARIGGDEFVVVLPGMRAEADAQRVGEKIAAVGRRPYDVLGQFLTITASVGMAHGAEADGGWRRLLERADDDMYRVKGRRGRHAFEP